MSLRNRLPARVHSLGRIAGRIAGSCAALLAIALPAASHHSQAMFDMGKCATVSGTVRTFQFQYPHSWLWLFVKNAQGGEDIWAFEFAGPSNLMTHDKRWSRDTVKKGDQVSVEFSPMKDGRKAGSMGSMRMSNGELLTVGTPACNGRFSKAAQAIKEATEAAAKSAK